MSFAQRSPDIPVRLLGEEALRDLHNQLAYVQLSFDLEGDTADFVRSLAGLTKGGGLVLRLRREHGAALIEPLLTLLTLSEQRRILFGLAGLLKVSLGGKNPSMSQLLERLRFQMAEDATANGQSIPHPQKRGAGEGPADLPKRTRRPLEKPVRVDEPGPEDEIGLFSAPSAPEEESPE